MLKKILIGIVVTVGVLMVSLFGSVLMLDSFFNTSKGNKEEILASSGQSPKSALIIYQPSMSDISSCMAHQIAKGLNDAGYQVTLNHPGEHLTTDLSKYSLVIFGSPVYAGQASKALTNYLEKVENFSTSRIVLYSTGSSPQDAMELETMEKFLNGAKAEKKVKFYTSAKKDNDQLAYNLGKELATK